MGTGVVQVGAFRTLRAQVGSLRGYGARAFGTLGVWVVSLWDIGSAHVDPLEPGGTGLRPSGVRALSLWSLGGTRWNLQDLGGASRKPSGVRGTSLWNLGGTGFEPLGPWECIWDLMGYGSEALGGYEF